MYDEVRNSLKQAYGAKVEERDTSVLAPWKVRIRQDFLDRLLADEKVSLLEIGAGTGLHGAFFQSQGMEVVSTDLSEVMVEACRAKGLEARQMDFLSLDFEEGSFDAVFALNCLLHVPRADLPNVLSNISRMLRPDGLFYWGQYGGSEFEGILASDSYRPKRFFSLLTKDAMKAAGQSYFELLDFETIDLASDREQFLSGLWRREA